MLPQSAFMGMMHMELDRLRQRLDEEMHVIMADVLQKIEANSAIPYGFIDTETDAVFSFTSQVAKLVYAFDAELESAVGDVEGDAAKAALAEIPAEVGRLKENTLDQFMASYRVMFTKWLRAARQQAETLIDR